jgi:hypothetical protein
MLAQSMFFGSFCREFDIKDISGSFHQYEVYQYLNIFAHGKSMDYFSH